MISTKTLSRLCIALIGALIICSCSSSEAPKTTVTLKSTTWEGSLLKTKNGATQHNYHVTVKFNTTSKGSYSFPNGSSDFEYAYDDSHFAISNCRYSNINGTWNIVKMDSKHLTIEKTDDATYQSFTLTPKAKEKSNK